MALNIAESGGGITFGIRVVTRASKSELAGEADGILRVRISAPPVDGAANDELIRLLAKRLNVARSSVGIVSGLASRNKRVRIEGITAEKADGLLS